MSGRVVAGRWTVAVLVCGGLLTWLAGPGWAQQPQPVPPPDRDRVQEPQQPYQQQPGHIERDRERRDQRMDQRESRDTNKGEALGLVRASKLMSAKVVNPSGTHLGSIDNLAVNADRGQVAYAVVATGGFIGMGEKKFAVPLQALNIRTDDRVVLDADKQTLKDMNGFKGNDYPATADARWLRHAPAEAGGYAEAGAEERGLIPFNFKGSDLVGKKVRNPQGDTLGTLHDLVIDPHNGRIIYGVISHGGKLGMGAQLTAVPWPAFDTREKDNLRLNIDKQRFDTAPTFSNRDWSALSDPDFMSRTNAFYGVRPGQPGQMGPGQPGEMNRPPVERREITPERQPQRPMPENR